jgi:hypothetical protein
MRKIAKNKNVNIPNDNEIYDNCILKTIKHKLIIMNESCEFEESNAVYIVYTRLYNNILLRGN